VTAEHNIWSQQHGASQSAPSEGAYHWYIRYALRSLVASYALAMRVAGLFNRSRRPVSEAGCEILLTGTFNSANWLRAHLGPLALSARCKRIRMVASSPIAPMQKVEPVYPPRWLLRALGPVPSRLLVFFWVGLRSRPHVVGGFHLLVNGLSAALLGRLTGAASYYFCVGGAAEIRDGGISSEARLFSRIQTPDPTLERQLLRAVGAFDLVVTMGQRTASFLRQRGVPAPSRVVSGGLDPKIFRVSDTTPTTDLILVARLFPIKRVDRFVHAIKHVHSRLPHVRATIVGDGPLRGSLEDLVRTFGLERHVTFAGQQHNVQQWLTQARVFALTSDSESLALSLMEAMFCGLPAVVSRVGDLEDLVEDGVNGFVVSDLTPAAFADRFLDLLTDPAKQARFSEAARRSATRYEIGTVSRLWDDILPAPPFTKSVEVVTSARRSQWQRT
jgi:glycosyltransferase involved in cell wall biosynthesis